MGGILQPPCPYGRHIGSCCLPQTRLLAHFIHTLSLKHHPLSSLCSHIKLVLLAFKLKTLPSFRPPSSLSRPFPNPATNRSSPPLTTSKNKQRIQAYRRRMKQDDTLNKLHLHQPQSLPFSPLRHHGKHSTPSQT